MGPYSHFILAARLETHLQPDHRTDYFWGAVAPDIRYLANMRRDQTHLEPERIRALRSRYPHLRSFLCGYELHLWTDQVDVSKVVLAAFPLRLFKSALRGRITHQQMTMLVELYYLRSGADSVPLSGTYNAFLADLGVTAEQARVYHQGLQEYFAGRTVEAAMNAFQKIGMIENDRVEKYLRAYRAMQKQRMLKAFLMLSIKNARLDTKVVEFVKLKFP